MKLNIKRLFKGDRYIPKRYAYTFLAIWALAVLVFSADTVFQIADSKKVKTETPNVQGVQVVTYQEPYPLPTYTPTPEPTPIETYDPDPIINCDFSYIPDRQMRNSACLKSTECEINGKWVFYASRDQCIKDQNAANPTTQQNTVTKKEVEQMIVKNQVESMNRQLQNDKYNNCMSQAQTESLSCMAECSKKDQEYTNACDAAYFNGDNYNSEMYQACNAQRRTETSACNDKCFEITKKCQY